MKKLLSLGAVCLFVGMTATTLSGGEDAAEAGTFGTSLSEHGGWYGLKSQTQTGKFTALTAPGCLSIRATVICRSR
jgi:hypothetical protein